MNPVIEFFVNNYALLCIGIAMVFMSIQNIKVHTKESTYCLSIIGTTMLLAVILFIERHARKENLLELATWCSFLGYVIRPVCIIFFIRLADSRVKKVPIIALIPLVINLIIYSFALFTNVEALSTLVFYYTKTADGLVFNRGYFLFNFSSHLISLLYLGYLVYVSFKKLKGKHFSHGITLIICTVFVITAVVVESIFSNKDIQLLNVTIAVSALFYYLFLYSERARSDPLTGLFNRETYYYDLNKMNKTINAVIQLDMNGLKWINDNQGHVAGDNALMTIGRICEKNAKRNVYAYRLGGDEFTILAVNYDEEKVQSIVNEIKDDLSKTSYYCSIGYAIKHDNDETVEQLLRRAEEEMYKDKEEFYKQGKFERRKQIIH